MKIFLGKIIIITIFIIVFVSGLMLFLVYYGNNRRNKISEKCMEEASFLVNEEIEQSRQEQLNGNYKVTLDNDFIIFIIQMTFGEKYKKCLRNNGYYR